MEAFQIKIYPTAQRDVEDIINYLNTLSPQAAERY